VKKETRLWGTPIAAPISPFATLEQPDLPSPPYLPKGARGAALGSKGSLRPAWRPQLPRGRRRSRVRSGVTCRRGCLGQLVRCESTEQTIFLAVWASSEVHRIGLATIAPISDTKAPQTIDGKHLSLGIAHLVDELARRRIESVDMTVAEITDQ